MTGLGMHCDQSIYLWIQKFARNIVYFFKCQCKTQKDGARPAFFLIFVLLYVLFVLCRSLCCLCVFVYCTTATGWLPNCSKMYHIKFYLEGADTEVTIAKNKSKMGLPPLKSNCVCAVDIWASWRPDVSQHAQRLCPYVFREGWGGISL